MWVVDTTDSTVVRIDPSSNRVIATLPIGGPAGIATGGFLNRVDPGTLGVVGEQLDDKIADLAAGGGAVWVVSRSGAIYRIDQATREHKRFGIGIGASSVAFGDGFVWVANPQDGTLSRVDAKTNSVDKRTTVGRGATDLAVGEGSVWLTFGGG